MTLLYFSCRPPHQPLSFYYPACICNGYLCLHKSQKKPKHLPLVSIVFPCSWCPHRAGISVARLTSHLLLACCMSPSYVRVMLQILILSIPSLYFRYATACSAVLQARQRHLSQHCCPMLSLKIKRWVLAWVSSWKYPSFMKLVVELHHFNSSQLTVSQIRRLMPARLYG